MFRNYILMAEILVSDSQMNKQYFQFIIEAKEINISEFYSIKRFVSYFCQYFVNVRKVFPSASNRIYLFVDKLTVRNEFILTIDYFFLIKVNVINDFRY